MDAMLSRNNGSVIDFLLNALAGVQVSVKKLQVKKQTPFLSRFIQSYPLLTVKI